MVERGDYSCVLARGEEVLFASRKSGIAPLLELIDSGIDAVGATAADKIVGKAAALLYVFMGVSRVEADVLSEAGEEVLRTYSIAYSAKVRTKHIVNRRGDDICPMERAVADVESPKEAVAAVSAALRQIRRNMEVIKGKNFGFGLMRLPTIGEEIDYAQVKQMVDEFIGAGFSYFDTAKGYHGERSEAAFRECVAKRYPRDRFTITDKLSQNYFESEEDIRKCFEEQLETCGVEYFDYYFMHAQGRNNYPKYKRCRAYEIAKELKAEGKIRHIGFSFHDTADYLDMILREQPEVELVQIQLNYIDFEDPKIQSRRCLEVCRKHGKPVVVMEPVKGGRLVNLPKEAEKILSGLHGGSAASYAIRFAAGQEGVRMVLSGMSNLEQLRDNLSFMRDFRPLDEKERAAVEAAAESMRVQDVIPCTGCAYCVAGCPKRIPIPDLFADMNGREQWQDREEGKRRYEAHTRGKGRASDCIRCGKCEQICPQHLPVREFLQKTAKTFET